MAHVWVKHAFVFVSAGAHPVGDGLQNQVRGVCHAQSPTGWAPTKIHPCLCSVPHVAYRLVAKVGPRQVAQHLGGGLGG